MMCWTIFRATPVLVAAPEGGVPPLLSGVDARRPEAGSFVETWKPPLVR
jgi:hypothetical protein